MVLVSFALSVAKFLRNSNWRWNNVQNYCSPPVNCNVLFKESCCKKIFWILKFFPGPLWLARFFLRIFQQKLSKSQAKSQSGLWKNLKKRGSSLLHFFIVYRFQNSFPKGYIQAQNICEILMVLMSFALSVSKFRSKRAKAI